MRKTPEIQYAMSGDLHIAYEVVGEGSFDLVFVPAFVSHIAMWWEEPLAAGFLERLASFSRLIRLDVRGAGSSDRPRSEETPLLEDRMDDVRAVMDAVDSKRAALFGASEGGGLATLFAATYPERTQGLILWAAYPRAIRDRHFPEGWLPREEIESRIEEAVRMWAEGEPTGGQLPPGMEFERMARWQRRMHKLAITPGGVAAFYRTGIEYDIRHLLPAVQVPTLVMVREGDENRPASRYMAEHIPGARYVELPGDAHGLLFRYKDGGEPHPSEVLDIIEEFLTGAPTTAEPNRVLATVLFTDIVKSTERAAALGDRRWRELLESHRKVVRDQIESYGGREIETTGDGFLATFDGPARAVRCAAAVRDSARELGIEIRAGVHTGEIELLGKDVAGIAVHIAARVASLARPGEILTSSTVKDLVTGSGIRFAERGTHTLKGVPDQWHLFSADV